MAKSNNLSDFLTDIASSIKTVKGTTGTINAQNFSTQIASMYKSEPTGNIELQQATSTNVKDKATATVKSGSATTPATTITSAPSISVSSSGLITATNSKTQSVTPTVSSGWVSSGSSGTITVSGSNTKQLTTKGATTYTPTTSNQTIASGTYLTGTQTIKGDSNLIASNIKNGVSIFGITGTSPSGPTKKYFYGLMFSWSTIIPPATVFTNIVKLNFFSTSSKGSSYTLSDYATDYANGNATKFFNSVFILSPSGVVTPYYITDNSGLTITYRSQSSTTTYTTTIPTTATKETIATAFIDVNSL